MQSLNSRPWLSLNIILEFKTGICGSEAWLWLQGMRTAKVRSGPIIYTHIHTYTLHSSIDTYILEFRYISIIISRFDPWIQHDSIQGFHPWIWHALPKDQSLNPYSSTYIYSYYISMIKSLNSTWLYSRIPSLNLAW